MRNIFICLNLIGLLFAQTQISIAKAFEAQVEIVEIRDLGLSESDENKSVIEVRWRVKEIEKEKIVSFNVILFVTYADGTTINEKCNAEKTANSARLEVSSVKTFGNRPPAFIKKLNAKVTAVIQKQ